VTAEGLREGGKKKRKHRSSGVHAEERNFKSLLKMGPAPTTEKGEKKGERNPKGNQN